MDNLKNLRISYEKLVNNLSKQGVDINNLSDLVNKKSGEFSSDINNLQILLHKMEHTKVNYNKQDFSKQLSEQLTKLSNDDLIAGNIDLEMYLSWLGDDEFSEHKKR